MAAVPRPSTTHNSTFCSLLRWTVVSSFKRCDHEKWLVLFLRSATLMLWLLMWRPAGLGHTSTPIPTVTFSQALSQSASLFLIKTSMRSEMNWWFQTHKGDRWRVADVLSERTCMSMPSTKHLFGVGVGVRFQDRKCQESCQEVVFQTGVFNFRTSWTQSLNKGFVRRLVAPKTEKNNLCRLCSYCCFFFWVRKPRSKRPSMELKQVYLSPAMNFSKT